MVVATNAACWTFCEKRRMCQRRISPLYFFYTTLALEELNEVASYPPMFKCWKFKNGQAVGLVLGQFSWPLFEPTRVLQYHQYYKDSKLMQSIHMR